MPSEEINILAKQYRLVLSEGEKKPVYINLQDSTKPFLRGNSQEAQHFESLHASREAFDKAGELLCEVMYRIATGIEALDTGNAELRLEDMSGEKILTTVYVKKGWVINGDIDAMMEKLTTVCAENAHSASENDDFIAEVEQALFNKFVELDPDKDCVKQYDVVLTSVNALIGENVDPEMLTMMIVQLNDDRVTTKDVITVWGVNCAKLTLVEALGGEAVIH